MPESLFVVRFGFRKRIDMLFRDDKNVRRRLWAEVVKCHADLVFINLGRWNSSIDYLTEDTILNRHIEYRKLNHKAAG